MKIKTTRNIPKVNMAICDLIKKLGEVDNLQNCFYLPNSIIEQIPCFKFKFKNAIKHKEIYQKLSIYINQFNGFLQWTLYFEEEQDPRRYYIIIPKLYAGINCLPGERKDIDSNAWYAKKQNLKCQDELFGVEKYREVCSLALKDIPCLISWLEEKFKI